jgi:hypothetical protein
MKNELHQVEYIWDYWQIKISSLHDKQEAISIIDDDDDDG